VDVKHVARDLGVRYVLEGSVRKAGNRVRRHGSAHRGDDRRASLGGAVRPGTRRHIAVQDEIVAAIVGTLVPEIGAAEGARAHRKLPRTSTPGASISAVFNAITSSARRHRRIAKAVRPRDRLDSTFADPYVFRALTGIAAYYWDTRPRQESLEPGSRICSACAAIGRPKRTRAHHCRPLAYDGWQTRSRS